MAAKKAKEKEPEAPVKIRNVVDISLLITTPNGTVVGKDFTITNPSGCMSPLAINNPVEIVDTLRAGLVLKYGANSVKE